MLCLWGYDLVKFWAFGDLLLSRGIDPVVFLYFDVVTVPPFILGSSRLINALTGKVMAWPEVLGWGLIVIINTLIPYVYAAMAGAAGFDRRAWEAFWVLVFLVLANLFRTICTRVNRKKRPGSCPE
ncbi:MAG: hypothetical protein MI863_05525 [Desulfobacterales bacterium]|nr:hypothetical protein [Desulfobacterales bacterium]